MLYPVEKLLADRDPLLCVDEGETVRDALVKMVQHDFSQLPIVDKQGNLAGIISEQSITRSYYHLDEKVSVLDLKVTACSDKPVTLPMDRNILDALDRLQSIYAVVIVDGRKPVGILTNHDTTNFFRDLSEGLILVEDIEVTLRQYIDDALPGESEREQAIDNAFRHLKKDGSTVPTYDRMSFGDYINLITNNKNWEQFERQLESKQLFRQYMEQVREIRNQLAHFRGRLDAIQYDVLKRASEWLANRPKVVQLRTVSALAESGPVYATGKSQGTYSLLQEWLATQAQQISPGYDIQRSFQQIEDLVGDELPPSAREHRSWWANDAAGGRHSLSWMNAGWKIESVDFSAETVVFRRTDTVLYQLFFADLLDRLKSIRPGITRAIKTSPQNWFSFSGGRTGFEFGWTVTQTHNLTVFLYINPGDKVTNDKAFDAVKEQQQVIENGLNVPILWERREHTTTARISAIVVEDFHITAPAEELESAKEKAVEIMLKFVDIIQPRIKELVLE